MSRRAAYIYAADLPGRARRADRRRAGQATSDGTISLLAPTVDVTHTGQEAVIDGVRVVFQVTPGTEAPAEMNFFFPGRRALCMAENATHTLHQILTLRGAEVRDARGLVPLPGRGGAAVRRRHRRRVRVAPLAGLGHRARSPPS